MFLNQINLTRAVKWLTFALLLAPFVTPRTFYFPFVGPKSLFFMGLVEIIVFAWVLLMLQYKRYRPRKNILTLGLMAFFAVTLLSTLTAANPSLAFWSKFERMTGLLMWFHLIAFYLASTSVFEKKDWLRVFNVSIFLGAVMGIISRASNDPALQGGGLTGNDSFLGTYLLFNIFLALYLALSAFRKGASKSIVEIAYPSVCGAIMVLALFASQAHAAQISFMAGLILLGFLWAIARTKGIIRTAIAGILAVIILGGSSAAFLATRPGSGVYQWLTSNYSVTTVYSRIVIWNMAWDGFKERPLLGWGPENFESLFSKYYNPCLGTGACGPDLWYDRSHNIIFDTLSTVGLLGLMAYLSIFIAALFILWKQFSRNAIGFAEAGVFTALLGAYAMQNLTIFDMINSYLMWFVALGFIGTLAMPPRIPEKRPTSLPFWQAVAAGGALIVCLSVFIINPLRADRNVVHAASQLFGSIERLEMYEKTFDVSPMGKFQERIFFADIFLRLDEKEKSKMTAEQRDREFAFATGGLEKSIVENPIDYKSRLVLGQLYTNWALYDASKVVRAQEVLEEVIKISPKNQQGYWNLAQVMVYRGKFEDALNLAQTAYDLYPESQQSAAILANINKIIQADSQSASTSKE